MSDMVTLTLAHPLTAKQADRLHAKDSKDYRQGDKITVPQADAIAIINGGYAAVDPTDSDAVQAVLKGKQTTASPSESGKDAKGK